MINQSDSINPQLVECKVKNYFYNLACIKNTQNEINNNDTIEKIFNFISNLTAKGCRYLLNYILECVLCNLTIFIGIFITIILLYIRYRDHKRNKKNRRIEEFNYI